MGMMNVPLGMKTGVLLIALALGYVVCYLAKREDKKMQLVGFAIGSFVIAASALLILANFCMRFGPCSKKFKCHPKMMMKGQAPHIAAPEQAPQQ